MSFERLASILCFLLIVGIMVLLTKRWFYLGKKLSLNESLTRRMIRFYSPRLLVVVLMVVLAIITGIMLLWESFIRWIK
jgi:uncharacterized membrane protein YidH (DUF202 family)